MTMSRAMVVPKDVSNYYRCRKNMHPPIVSNQALMLYSTIDAKVKRDVGTINVPRVLIQTKSKGKVIIRLNWQMAKQLASINPKYAKDMVIKKGQPVDKVLYGILNTSLLFWKDLTSTIGD